MVRRQLRDEPWSRVERVLLSQRRTGRRGRDDRNFIEAVLWWRRTGVPWRDLPEEFGSWKTVFNRFDRWSKDGRWSRLFEALRVEPDDEWHSLDSTINRAHQHAAGAKGGAAANGIGRSRGGPSTKVHLVVDALGLPLTFEVTEGQRNDIVPAQELASRARSRCLIADKAYDASAFRASLEAAGCTPVIPWNLRCATSRSYDKELYKARAEVERTFNLLKQSRRFATRYEKTLRTYAAVVALGCAMLWLRI